MQLSHRGLALIWFGAAVSLAEILTGTLFAPLGFTQGVLAIIIGHLIGCALFFLAGYIGAVSGRSAMDSVKLTFGAQGGKFFSVLNVLQLVGWTSIMIFNGALAANALINLGETAWVWNLVIGLLIVIWVAIGVTNLEKINHIAVGALFLLTIVLSVVVFSGAAPAPVVGEMAFGVAVELSVAMPLSWLPLVADYTMGANKPLKATVIATLAYFIGSSWMYVIGLAAALYAGTGDIALIMLRAGLGVAGLTIIVFSTVTTTFLDAHSAGMSTNAIFSKASPRTVGIIVALLGTLFAIVFPVTSLEPFLYLIASVFAPMATIMIVDFLVLKQDWSTSMFAWRNLIIWIIGFILYRISLGLPVPPCGNTLIVMVITGTIAYLAHKLFPAEKEKQHHDYL